MNTPAHPWLAPATDRVPARYRVAHAFPYRAILARFAAHWRLLLALLALAALLLTFMRVVKEGVVQGDLRRSAAATLADDQWRCNVISNRARREGCRAQLTGATPDGAGNLGATRSLPPDPTRR